MFLSIKDSNENIVAILNAVWTEGKVLLPLNDFITNCNSVILEITTFVSEVGKIIFVKDN